MNKWVMYMNYDHVWELPYKEYLEEITKIQEANERELLRQEKERLEGFIWALKTNWGIKK